MTVQEVNQKFDHYVSKWNNKKQEVVDPNNKYQCFDLEVGWISSDQDGETFLGIPRETTAFLYAFQIWTSGINNPMTRQYFDFIPNTVDAIPQKGDVVVFKSGYGSYSGHVGVCNGVADLKNFQLFSQNDPLNSPCHIQQYHEKDYYSVYGWLRPKTTASSPISNDQKIQQEKVWLTQSLSGDQFRDKVKQLLSD